MDPQWGVPNGENDEDDMFFESWSVKQRTYDEDALWCEELLECPAELSATSEYLHVLFAKIVSLYTEIMDSPRSKFMLALAVCAMILLLIWVYAQHKWERKAFLHLLREEIGGNNRVMSKISKNIESLLVNPSSKRVLHLLHHPGAMATEKKKLRYILEGALLRQCHEVLRNRVHVALDSLHRQAKMPEPIDPLLAALEDEGRALREEIALLSKERQKAMDSLALAVLGWDLREIDRAAAQLELMGLDEAAKELSKERRIELEEISVEMTAEIRSELRRKIPNGEHMRYLWAKALQFQLEHLPEFKELQAELSKQEADEIHAYLNRMRGVLMALRYTDHCGTLEDSERKTTTAATGFLEDGSTISNTKWTKWKDNSSGDLKADADAATTDENEIDNVLAAATSYPPPMIKKSLAERADFRRMVFDACVMKEGKEQEMLKRRHDIQQRVREETKADNRSNAKLKLIADGLRFQRDVHHQKSKCQEKDVFLERLGKTNRTDDVFLQRVGVTFTALSGSISLLLAWKRLDITALVLTAYNGLFMDCFSSYPSVLGYLGLSPSCTAQVVLKWLAALLLLSIAQRVLMFMRIGHVGNTVFLIFGVLKAVDLMQISMMPFIWLSLPWVGVRLARWAVSATGSPEWIVWGHQNIRPLVIRVACLGEVMLCMSDLYVVLTGH